MKLKDIAVTLGIPLGLVGVIAALLLWMGVPLDKIESTAATLIGLQLSLAFLVDVLKWAGVVSAGSSGKWSAGLNLITLVGVAVWLGFFPYVDVYAIDAQLLDITKLLIPIFAYITQMIGTKAVHQTASGLRWTFTF